MKTLMLLAALLAVPLTVQAQNQNATQIVPDCVVSLSAGVAATSVNYHNTKNCTFWTFSYHASGFSAISIQPEYAPDGATPNTAGSFLVYPSAQLDSGSLPLTTATEGQISMFGYHPWMRIELLSKTGSGLIVAVLNGWTVANGDSNSGGGAAVTCAACATAANQINGNQVTQVSVLPAASGPTVSTSADSVVLSYEPRGQGVSTVAMSGTTSTQVIAGLASNYIYVQHCSLANDSTTVSTRENFQDGSGGTSILQTANPAASVATTGGGGAEVSFGGGVLYVPTLGNGLFVANVTTGSATTVSCQGFYSTKKYF